MIRTYALAFYLLHFHYLLSSAEQIHFSGSAGTQALIPNEAARHLGGSTYSTRFEDVQWNNGEWTITATAPRPQDYHGCAFTANGYFGATMSSIGPFVQFFGETNDWPLFNQRQTFSTVSGFFDRQPTTNGTNFPWLEQHGWDSVISGIPHWAPLIIEMEDGSYLAANTSVSELTNVVLTQDFRQGYAQFQYTWNPGRYTNVSLNITYTAFADKLQVNRGYVKLEVQSSQDCNVTLYNIIDGRTALRTDFHESGSNGSMIYTSVNPNGVSNVTAWVYAVLDGVDVSAPTPVNGTDKPFIGNDSSTIAQAFPLVLRRASSSTFVKYVGVASSDGFPDPQSQARGAVLNAIEQGFQSSLEAHIAEWLVAMPRNSTSDYSNPNTGLLPKDPALIEKAIISVVSVFSLLMNTIGENALALVGNSPININGISVCGLISDCYGGQRFWDQDFWMLPYLSSSVPSAAKQITNSRVAHYPQAKANVQTAYTSSKNMTTFSKDAAVYSWTSGRDGNCTATGPCFDYEYHINGDIAQSFILHWTGSGETDYFENELLPIMSSISTFYSNILVTNGTQFDLNNMTDPDEYANNINDGAFTMGLIAKTLNNTYLSDSYFGQQANSEWQSQLENVYIPRSGQLTLEYDTMNGSIEVKQADVVLLIYPLALSKNYSISQQQSDLDYYAGKQSLEGPGMTYAIFSVAANAISASGCSAYTYDKYSWSPYARAPWFQFSEELIDNATINGGTNPAFPFLTGHGGFLQVDTYGYLGLRRNADWILRINPSLPPQIEHLRYPMFYHHGWPIEAVSNQTHTVMTRNGNPLSTANMTFASDAISVLVDEVSQSALNNGSYQLFNGGSLVLANRRYSNNKTEPGNILQCRKVSSSAQNEPGLFPDAAIDGAVSTSWQPSLTNASQSLTVDLSNAPFQKLSYAYFDWAQQPPVNATIILHNYTNWDDGYQISIVNITVNKPYNKSAANKIQQYEGNTTTVDFEETVWSSNFASLVVSGNQGNSSSNAPGPTVAEFALVAGQ